MLIFWESNVDILRDNVEILKDNVEILRDNVEIRQENISKLVYLEKLANLLNLAIL